MILDELITVCIPSYNSRPYIESALKSVLAQTFSRFKILIAIEPTKDYLHTLRICEKYNSDGQIRSQINEKILGWGTNVNQLLQRVETPYFIILPHDDVLHPSYMEALYDKIQASPDVMVAYADMAFFDYASGFKSLEILGGRSFNRLLSFYLGGAEAVPWRGVTRTSILNNGFAFPDNEFGGYAVECEWAQNMLIEGEAIRVPESLYFKRIPAENVMTASRSWSRLYDKKTQYAAKEHHRETMLKGLQRANLPEEQYRIVQFALEAAMLRRKQPFIFDGVELQKIDGLMKDIESESFANQHMVMSRVNLCLSRNAFWKNDLDMAIALAEKAYELDASNIELLEHLAILALHQNKPNEALKWLGAATSISRPTRYGTILLGRCLNEP